MMEALPPPNRKQLREFGLVTGGLFALIFGLFIPWIWHFAWPIWPWIVLAVLGSWALVHPDSLIIVYKPWMKGAMILGWINTRIIMTLLFFVILLPVALIMRLFKHDPLQKHLDSSLDTYRTPRTPRDKQHMERPF